MRSTAPSKRAEPLLLAGNGGSMADALHISAELLKSYARPRPCRMGVEKQLSKQPDGDLLRHNLQHWNAGGGAGG